MPRFSEREREQLFDEYVRLKAEGLSDAKIARRFGVSQMTIVRWKRRFMEEGGAERLREAVSAQMRLATESEAAPGLPDLDPAAPAEAPQAGPRLPPFPAYNAFPTASVDANEVVWLRELASRLLFENERLKAIISGNLPPRRSGSR
jgi:transposase-like protein